MIDEARKPGSPIETHGGRVVSSGRYDNRRAGVGCRRWSRSIRASPRRKCAGSTASRSRSMTPLDSRYPSSATMSSPSTAANTVRSADRSCSSDSTSGGSDRIRSVGPLRHTRGAESPRGGQRQPGRGDRPRRQQAFPASFQAPAVWDAKVGGDGHFSSHRRLDSATALVTYVLPWELLPRRRWGRSRRSRCR